MMAPADPVVFDRYWDCLSRGDRAGALAIALELRAAGTRASAIFDQLVVPGQLEVGARWAASEWDVAQEHRATSISEDVVAAISATVSEPDQPVRHALLTCAEGEWHAMPLRILSASLREHGWRVTSLGASVPARHLHQILHDVGPDVVGLSSSLPTRLFEARRTIEVSRGAGIPVLAGGPAFGPDGRWALRLGATGWAANAAGVIAEQLPRFVEPAPALEQPDDSAFVLRRAQDEIVHACMKRLPGLNLPDVEDYTDEQLARTREDFGYISQYLAASLYVDDVALFTDFATWLAQLLAARGLPVQTVTSGLGLVQDAITDLGEHPRALGTLAAGTAAASTVR